MTAVDHSFGRLCQDAVGETLEHLGFKLVGTFSIPKTYSVEYACADRTLFLILDGGVDDGVVHVELLLDDDGRSYRVDLTSAVWNRSNTPRPIPSETVHAQVKRLVTQLEEGCSDILAGDLSGSDSRFCFPLQPAFGLEDYRKTLRGVD
jgi:hypothetical protein